MEINFNMPKIKFFSFEETIDGVVYVFSGSLTGEQKKTIEQQVAELDKKKEELLKSTD